VNDFAERVARLSPQKLALLAQELQARLAAVQSDGFTPVAVVGVGCRFPGADGPDAFWRLLRDGVDAIREVPPDRWSADAYYDPDPEAPGRMNTRWGGFLDGIDLFDPQFFGISPREAAGMDPQQRLLLEVCWEALEHAAIAPERLAGAPAGVFVGISGMDYLQLVLQHGGAGDTYFATGLSHAVAAGRISYTLGLRGPALALDTACSSSLVALHLACQSLYTGECRVALAGGSNAILTPQTTVALAHAHMMAADGRCKTFAADADGFVRSEGCGIVVLKRLADAQADGDRILAVVAGSAINQDGRSSGLTAPNGPAQEAVIRQALRRADCRPEEVDYVEAHGTGTVLGDPIELRALAAVLGEDRPADRPVRVGSVKTNVGHLESAAGVAGVIKTVLAIQHELIPRHLHVRELNPHVPWAELPLQVTTEASAWPRGARRRVAGVSSFGFSGTNAHIVLTEPPEPSVAPAAVAERPVQVLCLSAGSDRALRRLAAGYDEFLAQSPAALADVCYTANTGRSLLAHRAGIVVATSAEAREALASLRAGVEDQRVSTMASPEQRPEVVFLFPGQGAQYAGMGRALYETEPAFRRTLDRCDEILKPLLGCSLESLFYGADAGRMVEETLYTQPALFAFEVALAELWRSWGVEPAMVLGHSLGEYAAACVAGVFGLEDGLRLVAARGRLMQALPAGGGMAALGTDADRAARLVAELGATVSIAARNGPVNTVISGVWSEVERVVQRFEADGGRVHRIAVSHASHSPLLDPMLEGLTEAAAAITMAAPRIALVSNLTGALATPELLRDPQYWRRHAREAVQFESGIGALHELGGRVFLEVGPAPVLTGMGRACVEDPASLWTASLKKDRPDERQMAEAVRDLRLRGVDIDWVALNAGRPRRRLALPTTPFDRTRYFVDARPGDGARQQAGAAGIFTSRIETAHGQTIVDGVLGVEALPFLDEHRVFGNRVVPASMHLALVAAAAQPPAARLALEDLTVETPLVLAASGGVPLQLVLTAAQPGPGGREARHVVEVYSRSGRRGAWVRHFAATVVPASPAQPDVPRLAELRARCAEQVAPESLYERLGRVGVAIGPGYRAIQASWRGPNEALARLALAPGLDRRTFSAHPLLLDTCLHLLGAARWDAGRDDAYLMIGADHFELMGALPSVVWAHARLRPAVAGDEVLAADARLFDDDGRLLAELQGVRLRRVTSAALRHAVQATEDDWLYEVAWREAPPAAVGARVAPAWSPAELARRLIDLPAVLAEQHGLGEYVEMIGELESLALDYLLRALGRLGWSPRVGEPVVPGELARRLAIAPAHVRLFDRCLEMLEGAGWLSRTGGGYTVASLPGPSDAPDERAARLEQRFPSFAGAFRLLRAAGEGLDAVLCGAEDPVRVLFADASLEAVESVTRHTPSARVFNTLVARIVADAVSAAVDRPLRVLEIGAGTGATTASVLPILPPERTDYVFTDVSQLFLARAAEAFAAHPFVEYRRLDIERDPAAQGFELESFDIVLAANVLHATRDLAQSIRNARSLLAPGGLLVLLEGTARQCWIDLTFGLTTGWWSFADYDLRPSYPLLPVERWQALIPTLGFDELAVLPGVRSLASAPAQMVLAARAAPAPSGASAHREGSWLIVGGSRGLSDAVAGQLSARGYRAVCVGAAGDVDGSPRGIPHFVVDPADPATYLRLLADPRVLGGCPLRGCVHLVATEARGGASLDLEGLEHDTTEACRSALFIVQTVAASAFDVMPRVWLITRQAVGDAAGARLGGASLWGLGRTISMEHPEAWGGLIDLDDRSDDEAARVIVEEIESATREDEIVVRGGSRRVARLVPARVASGARPVELRHDASYLLTGATGGMGLHVARWLIDRGAHHLMLLSRAGRLPAGELAALRSTGADVRVRAANVSSRAEMSAIFEEIRTAMPPLAGVLHAAGIFEDGVLRNQDWLRFARVLAPKVAGAWILHELTRGLPLDFFVLFSSAASVLGPVGLSNYAAANAFLDALAGARRAAGLPAVAIDWGAWARTGMAAAVGERRENQWTVGGFDTITPEEGLEILERALGPVPPQVSVIPMNWPIYMEWLGDARQRPLFREVARGSHTARTSETTAPAAPGTEAEGPAELRQRLRAAAPGERLSTLAACIASEAKRVLGFGAEQAIDTERSLFQLGLDSLTAVEMRNRLQVVAGRPLPPAVAFDHPSIAAMAAYLCNLPGFFDTAAADPHLPTRARDHAASLLEQLPGLSDEEVSALLEQMAAEEGGA
jgi:acyl transferase domain-containing protein/SAM-dependent methyltransferase/NAD(P)-dependent dehydrogenase (short-subunit alcohol dehydrogenase family)